MLLLVKTPQRTELDLTWMTPYWKPALIVWEIHISCWGKKQSIVLPSWDAYNRSNDHYDKIDPQIPRCVMDKLLKIFSYRKTYSYKRSNDKLMDNFKKNLPEENLMLLFCEKDIVQTAPKSSSLCPWISTPLNPHWRIWFCQEVVINKETHNCQYAEEKRQWRAPL